MNTSKIYTLVGCMLELALGFIAVEILVFCHVCFHFINLFFFFLDYILYFLLRIKYCV